MKWKLKLKKQYLESNIHWMGLTEDWTQQEEGLANLKIAQKNHLNCNTK